MSSYGVQSTGFVIKTVQDILDDIEAGEKEAFGSVINVSADSVFGQLNGVIAGAIAEAWELAEAVYSAQYPNSANDASLDNVCAITGVGREEATQSTVELTLTGTAGTFLFAGRVVAHSVNEERYATDADVTIAVAGNWIPSYAFYSIGLFVTNNGNIYICTGTGTTASSGGPSGEGTGIVDGTVTWDFVGNGTGYVQVDATAEEYGPQVANARSLTEIETPVSGWESVINLLDADVGSDLETDADLRQRREEQLAVQGAATLNAIKADLLNVDGVLSVTMFENIQDVTDSDGRPAHSIEAVVLTTTGDTPDATIDQAVADQLFESKAGGIGTFGFPGRVVTKTVTDDSGNTHTVYWTRVEELEIYCDITVTVNTDPADGPVYPADGDDQVKAAIVAKGNELLAGQEVIYELIKCQAFQVSGVTDITSFTMDTVSPPTGTSNITVTDRQVAVFDTSRVDVTS